MCHARAANKKCHKPVFTFRSGGGDGGERQPQTLTHAGQTDTHTVRGTPGPGITHGKLIHCAFAFGQNIVCVLWLHAHSRFIGYAMCPYSPSLAEHVCARAGRSRRGVRACERTRARFHYAIITAVMPAYATAFWMRRAQNNTTTTKTRARQVPTCARLNAARACGIYGLCKLAVCTMQSRCIINQAHSGLASGFTLYCYR